MFIDKLLLSSRQLLTYKVSQNKYVKMIVASRSNVYVCIPLCTSLLHLIVFPPLATYFHMEDEYIQQVCEDVIGQKPSMVNTEKDNCLTWLSIICQDWNLCCKQATLQGKKSLFVMLDSNGFQTTTLEGT